ncbi:asparagine synthase (glutamine-hydrolyzing) [Saccharopolyspora taberi]|uniref:asparagine synthase (glutamine-hydrolyzing) n=2 Tax=Saccharopolyspora taberi TaxID=60895 RepID=A0ABN3VJ15_9PSEU
MTDTMTCRGPDAYGVWAEGHAALGHRRLAVIDIDGGRQPMTAGGDDPAAVLTFSGEVYNYRELRSELAARGHHFRTSSDTEVVLRSYLEWGEDCVSRLNGMFAFAVWDKQRETLVLVRDRLGVKPLFYFPTPHGVLFGSEPKAILAHPSVEAEVDAEGFAELLAMVKTPEHGIFRGMYEVRPGSLVRVRRSGIVKRRYWSLEAREHADDLDATVGTVRDLLEDTVSRQLVADVPLCTLLSGGLDSSVVTALAARELAERGSEPIRSFSVDFAGYTENFTASAMRETPDTPFAYDLAAHVGAKHENIVLTTDRLTDPEVRDAVLRARDMPGMGDMDTSLYLLFSALREQSTVALSGESADEIFGGYRWFYYDECLNADTFPWLAIGYQSRKTELLNGGLLATLDLPAHRADSYRDALTEMPDVPGEDAHERRMRVIAYLAITRYMPILLDRKDRMSMATGLEVRVPFCDHRLVDYVFNAPWSMKRRFDREKSLLRDAAQDLLPRSIIERKKVPYPATQDSTYTETLRKQVADLYADHNAPVRALLDEQAVRQVVDGPHAASNDENARAGLELVLQLDNWLSRYDIRLRL